MTETWKAVVGFEGLYEVSDLGRVRSLSRDVLVQHHTGHFYRKMDGRVLRACGGNGGYPCVNLWFEGRVLNRKVHLIVADAFLGPRTPGTEVCHRDGNRNHNAAANLRRDTPTNNNADKIAHGTLLLGESCPWAKLTENDIRAIRAARGRLSQSTLADIHGVTRSHISTIQSGKVWRHV